MLKHYLSSNVTPKEEVNLEVRNTDSNEDVMDSTDQIVSDIALPKESYRLLGKY